MAKRIYNFSAGPSQLPLPVLEKAASELVCWGDSGMSVMEMSHRSKAYQSIIDTTEQRLRNLIGIPDNYKVLFLQGGASTQFAMVPMNLMNKNHVADYAVTGQFSGKAYEEAQKFGDARCVATTKDIVFTRIPQQNELNLSDDADYMHICFNNTIYGTKWNYIPETKCPLIADMSSCMLSEPVDVTKFGLIYAGAQKNMGPAGVTVVFVREDLIGDPIEGTPTMLTYATHAKNGSMYNTPPTYSIYMVGLVAEWLESIGGLEEMKKINLKKSAMLYDYLDSSKMFINPVEKSSRSMMNVTFKTESADLDAEFVAAATAEGLCTLKGHRSVGGMRASIYNGMPIEGVEKLVDFMGKFEKNH